MDHVRTSPFYPQSNGKIERFHQNIKRECIRPQTPLDLDDARSGLKTDTSQMTPIFSHWQGELSEGIAQLFRGQINATSGEKRKSDEVVRF
jgi:transposase InsO family protein